MPLFGPLSVLWGKFFCRDIGFRFFPVGMTKIGRYHDPGWEKKQFTGRTRPYTMPYLDGRGRRIYRGSQVIFYRITDDGRRVRESPPTQDELERELREYRAPCLKCGGTVRWWSAERKDWPKKGGD